MVLTVSFVLSPVIGFLVTVICENGCRSPVGMTCLRRRDAGVEASGPHDFAVRISAVRQQAVRSLTDPKRTRPAITRVPDALHVGEASGMMSTWPITLSLQRCSPTN